MAQPAPEVLHVNAVLCRRLTPAGRPSIVASGAVLTAQAGCRPRSMRDR